MENQPIDATALVVSDTADYLPAVEDIDQAIRVYDKIREEARKRLKKGVDFGKIPGTNKPTLLQPGADKLNNFFGLASEIVTVEKELNLDKDWAYYKAKATLRLKKSGNIVAVAEASINSQESKYFYQLHPDQNPDEWKRVYQKGPKKGQPKESVRLPDLLNTLEAMAQKRAYVKATRHAHGLTDLYTQDVEDMPSEAVSGDSTPKSAPTGDHDPDELLTFGKHQGEAWSAVDVDYLGWLAKQVDKKTKQPSPNSIRAQTEIDRRNQPEPSGDTPPNAEADPSDRDTAIDWLVEFAKLHPDIVEKVTGNEPARYQSRAYIAGFGDGWREKKMAELQKALEAK